MSIYSYTEHPVFDLFIYADIGKRQKQFRNMLAGRKSKGLGYNLRPIVNGARVNSLGPVPPLFFENTDYAFKWKLKNVEPYIIEAKLNHKLKVIHESKLFTVDRNQINFSISITNDIGWFHLPISYKLSDGTTGEFEFAFEVLPSKMELYSDLLAMYSDIDEHYPLWRFNLAEKAEQSFGNKREQTDFPLLWLAQFQRLQAEFAKALTVIANSPHNRLQVVEKQLKAEQIKGRVPERTALKIRNDLKNNLWHKHYTITEKCLSVDTPENRFVKMAVVKSTQILAKFNRTLRKKTQENDRLSDIFFTCLNDWQKPLSLFQQQPFMQQVGNFRGLMKESLVLQQRSGYSRVFQIWQELKHYLALFDRHTEISQKSVAEIYEVWCFLEIRRLLEKLGFNEILKRRAELIKRSDFSLKMKDDFGGSFHFEKEGIKIRLAHEAVFDNKENEGIKSFITQQKPDILLEITFQNTQRYILLFDAKYRIDTNSNNAQDLVPEDAINQMHRYRDALILLNEKELNPKSRPVFGAFALYPGFFNQQDIKNDNPYKDAIEQVGIGAFALLPSEDGSHSHWLRTFLAERLRTNHLQENLLLQHEARIADHGMIQTRYTNLVLMMGVGLNRSVEYLQKVENGKLAWYHTPVSTFELKYSDYLVAEIHFLGLAYQGEIERLYPVKSVKKLKCTEISCEQSGSENLNETEYYLFELAKPLQLEQPICNVPEPDMQGKGFTQSIKLIDLEQLDEINDFTEIISVYGI